MAQLFLAVLCIELSNLLVIFFSIRTDVLVLEETQFYIFAILFLRER